MLPEIIALIQARLSDLRRGKVDVEELLVRQNLSRKTSEYRVPSPTALAAMQLEATGKPVGAGQNVRFLYVMGKPKVRAWDLPQQNQAFSIDKSRYIELMVRAAAAVLQPLSVDEKTLRDWLFSNAGYGTRPGYLSAGVDAHFPLLAFNRIQRMG